MRFTEEMRAALAAQPRPDGLCCAFCGDSGHQAFECGQIHDARLEDEMARIVEDSIERFSAPGCHCTSAQKAAARILALLHRDGWHRHTADLFVGTTVPVAEELRVGGRSWDAITVDEAK